jgi:hypothetical protein
MRSTREDAGLPGVAAGLRLDASGQVELLAALVQDRHDTIGIDPRDERDVSGAKNSANDGQRKYQSGSVLRTGRLAQEKDRERPTKERGQLIRPPA